jgi:hypothetical protein
VIEAEQRAIHEASTLAKTSEPTLSYHLHLRLVAQMHAMFRKILLLKQVEKPLSRKRQRRSTVFGFVQVTATTMAAEMTAVQCTVLKKPSCVGRMTSFNRTNRRTVEFRHVTKSVAAGHGSHGD